MAKFRIRNLMGRVPFLDGLRLGFLANFCNYGTLFFHCSYKVTRFFSPGAAELLESGKPILFAVHHGRMIGLLRIFAPRNKLSILISRSRDGEIIARAVTDMGFSIARGSPAHGAVQGGIQMIKAAEAGQHLIVMVDGPRGPIFEVKPGIIRMAEMTNLPIIPFTCAAKSAWYFWGWDRFLGTLWGSPEVYLYGEPLVVPEKNSEDEREALRVQLETSMIKLREAADSYYGQAETAYGAGQVFAPNLRIDRKR